MRSLVAITLILSASAAGAQDQTLISDNATHGGYGGPIVKVTRFAGKDAVLIGGRGGFVVNGTYAFGGGGAGWTSDKVRGSDAALYDLSVSYGGVDFEYIHRTHSVVHPSVLLSLGGGGATQKSAAGTQQDDSFLFAEPGLHLEVNVARGFRMAAGVSYRIVSGLDLAAFSNTDIRGVSAVLTFKFGKWDETEAAGSRQRP